MCGTRLGCGHVAVKVLLSSCGTSDCLMVVTRAMWPGAAYLVGYSKKGIVA